MKLGNLSLLWAVALLPGSLFMTTVQSQIQGTKFCRGGCDSTECFNTDNWDREQCPEAYPCCTEENCGGSCSNEMFTEKECQTVSKFPCLPEMQSEQKILCCNNDCNDQNAFCDIIFGEESCPAWARYSNTCELTQCCYWLPCDNPQNYCYAATPRQCSYYWEECGEWPLPPPPPPPVSDPIPNNGIQTIRWCPDNCDATWCFEQDHGLDNAVPCPAYPCCTEESCGGICDDEFMQTEAECLSAFHGSGASYQHPCLPEFQDEKSKLCCTEPCEEENNNQCVTVFGKDDCTGAYSNQCGVEKCCHRECGSPNNYCFPCRPTFCLDCPDRFHCGDFPAIPPTTKNGGMEGDPHIHLWSHRWLDFHGQCDLVLVEAPYFGKSNPQSAVDDEADTVGLFVHARTQIRDAYSFISSMAIKIGEDVLEVSGFGEYSLNYINNAEMPNVLAGMYLVYHEALSDKEHIFRILLGSNGEEISIRTFKDFVGIKIEGASSKDFAESKGLLGDYTTGSMLARDGKTILEDPIAFGNEWQVQSNETFFQVARAPQYPDTCILPTASQKEARRLGGGVTEAAAKAACEWWGQSHMERCIFDCMKVGDLELAKLGP